MKKKYGFTLIELLAVIVVLAVIAMITTPIVFVIIKTAKKGAAEQSTVAYAKAIEDTVAIDAMNNRSYVNRDDYSYDEIKVDVSGSTPTGGLYALKDGIVTRGIFCVNGYRVNYSDSKAEAYENCDDLKWEGNIVLEETKGNLEYNKIKKVQIKENKANNSLIVSVEDENIAQARIENNELIITGKKLGTTKITLSSSETKNYSSASTEYIVTIIKASNKIVLSSTSGTYTYPNSGTFSITSNPSGGKLSCTTSNKNVAECTISGNTVTVKPGTTKGSATLTITSEATTNYNAGKAVYAVTTEQGKLSYTANGYEGTYNGNSHGITVTSSGATITYSTDGTNYSSTSPKYTNAGIYTVYYKIEKSGYNTITGNKQVIIIPSVPTITASDSIGSGSWHKSKYTLTFSSSGASSSVYYYYGTSSNPSTKGSSASISSDTGGKIYYVKACVSDSKCSAVSSYNAKLDSTKPNKPELKATIKTGNTESKYSGSWTNKSVTLTGSSTDSGSGIVKIEYSLDNQKTWKNDWGTLNKSNNNASVSGTWTSNYNTTLYARAVDAVGNISEISSMNLKIDKVSPSFGTVSLNPNLTSWTSRCGKKINVSWNLTDSGSGVKMQNGHPYLMRAYYSAKSRNTLLSPVYGYDSDATTKGNIYGGGGILKVCAYDYAGNETCFEKTLYQYCSSEDPWSLTYVKA